EGKVLGSPKGFGVIGAIGARQGTVEQGEMKYVDGRRGGFDPHARIPDMDLDGIDAAFLYPSVGLFAGAVTEPGLAAAMCRAYNRWLADYCQPYTDRLFGVAMLPMPSIPLAIEEVCFARNVLGLERDLGRRLRSPSARADRVPGIGRRMDRAVARPHGPSLRRPGLQRLRAVDAAERPVQAQLLDLVRARRRQPERPRRLHRAAQDLVGDRLSASRRLLPWRAEADRRPPRAVAGDEAPDPGRRRQGLLPPVVRSEEH